LLVQSPVRACPVVVRDIVDQDSTQVRLVDDEEVIEALPAHRPDSVFGVGVRRRGPVGRAHDLDPLGGHCQLNSGGWGNEAMRAR